MNFPPPRRRGNKTSARQELPHAPANVIMALIGQSRRRCVTITEMIDKQGMGLVQLQMECQQLASFIRQDPQGLNRLAISLHAARVALEKNKEHLQEQIQVELFLQGEFQHWLNGEPPTDFVPPPPGMTRRQISPEMTSLPQLGAGNSEEIDYDDAPYETPPPQQRSPQRAPYMMRPPQAPTPQPRMTKPVQPQHEPLLAPQAAFAAYQKPSHVSGHASGHIPTPEAAALASRTAHVQHASPSPQLSRMPVVRLPVEQYTAPAQEAPATAVNGGPASPIAHMEEDEGDSKNSSTPS
jgi:hypothetical protein